MPVQDISHDHKAEHGCGTKHRRRQTREQRIIPDTGKKHQFFDNPGAPAFVHKNKR